MGFSGATRCFFAKAKVEIFPWKIGATPRCREGPPKRRGPPRRRHARLGKPGDNRGGLSGPPRRGVGVTPQKYPRIFIIKIIIYSGYN